MVHDGTLGHARVMSRREFLGVMGGALAAACAQRTQSAREPAPSPKRAVAFDLFTLFDPRGVDQRVARLVGNAPGFSATWKSRLFEYSWLRAASNQYRDFEGLVHDALTHASRAHGVALTSSTREELQASFTELVAWPDSAATLELLRARGFQLAPLANFSPRMIEQLLDHAKLRHHFDALISTDRARTYKPDPRAYALAESVFGLPRAQIAFAAFGGWDAAGARWFGFPTFWVNRLSQADEELIAPHATGSDLGALSRWLLER